MLSHVVLCCVASSRLLPALDTDEKQPEIDDDTDTAVTALLESRKLSLHLERIVMKTGLENIFHLVEESPSPANEEKDESKRAPPSQRMCVTVTTHAGPEEEETGGGMQTGGLVALRPCQGAAVDEDLLESQLWKWDKATGEMIPFASLDTPLHGKTSDTDADTQEDKKGKSTSNSKTDSETDLPNSKGKSKSVPLKHPFCLTAGWPYLNSVAFLTPNQQTVVTVMNEYPTDTYVLLKDKKKGSMWTALNGKSIQTITF